jgi:hypothetical protein
MYKFTEIVSSGDKVIKFYNNYKDMIKQERTSEATVCKSLKEGFVTGNGRFFKFEKVLSKEEIKEKKIWTAVLFADMHVPYHDKKVVEKFLDFLEENKNDIDEIVDCGDGVDAGALSEYVCLEEHKENLFEEIEEYKQLTKLIKLKLPFATFTSLADNHYDLRLQRFLAKNPAMINMIKEIDYGYTKEIEHGVPYFPLSKYGQNKIAGIHGINFNDLFAKKLTTQYRQDMFQAHTHTIQIYCSENKLTGYGLPCMCKTDMKYNNGKPVRWRQGWTVLTWDGKNYEIKYHEIKGE